MWIDATVAASFVTGKDSTVADKVGFALAPDKASASAATGCGPGRWRFPPVARRSMQPRSSSPGRLPSTSRRSTLVAAPSEESWPKRAARAHPRTSLYSNPEYQKAAPFAKMTPRLDHSRTRPKPTVKPSPYVRRAVRRDPEFEGIGTEVRPDLSGALAGQPPRWTMPLNESARTPPPARCKKAGYL